MTSKKTLTILGILLLGLTSCKKYLDVKPYDLTIPTTVEEHMAILHTRLNKIDKGDNQPLIFSASQTLSWDLFADDFESALTKGNTVGLNQWVGFSQQGGNTTTYFKQLYEIIRDCNIVLAGMPNDGTDLSRNAFGTAYTMRGLAYLQLLRLYSPAFKAGEEQPGVPLIKEFDMEARPPRTTVQAVAQSIEQDLTKALTYHVDNADFLFTEDVTRGILVRLYFWTEQWDKVLTTAQPLLDKYPLLSGDAYKEMLSSVSQKGNVLIKVLQMSTSSQETERFEELKKIPVSARFVNLFPSADRDKDIRYKLSVDKKRIAKKSVFPGFRIAEVHLMATEAHYHLGQNEQALKMLNALRAARLTGVQPLTMQNLPDSWSDELITEDATGKPLTPLIRAILAERHKEFFMEGDRFFELKRNGSPEFWKAYNGAKYTTKKFMYCFPIPPEDIIHQPTLIQNEGYAEYTIGMPKA